MHTLLQSLSLKEQIYLPQYGTQTFKSNMSTRQEARVAKNYLKKKEFALLDRLVSAYLDLTEIKAMQQKQMKMNNWQKALDTF